MGEDEIVGATTDERTEHLLMHRPADVIRCEACMRANARVVRKMAGQSTRFPTHFGELITMYHVSMKCAGREPGLGAMAATLGVYDEATEYKASLPVPS